MITAELPTPTRFSSGPDAIPEWLNLIRAEYLEIPGLNLTRVQVRRLWNLDPVTCDALLDALVGARFLRRSMSGSYIRADNGGY
jgi:hypothetical protein